MSERDSSFRQPNLPQHITAKGILALVKSDGNSQVILRHGRATIAADLEQIFLNVPSTSSIIPERHQQHTPTRNLVQLLTRNAGSVITDQEVLKKCWGEEWVTSGKERAENLWVKRSDVGQRVLPAGWEIVTTHQRNPRAWLLLPQSFISEYNGWEVDIPVPGLQEFQKRLEKSFSIYAGRLFKYVLKIEDGNTSFERTLNDQSLVVLLRLIANENFYCTNAYLDSILHLAPTARRAVISKMRKLFALEGVPLDILTDGGEGCWLDLTTKELSQRVLSGGS